MGDHTVPALRFPDFQGNWLKSKLGQLMSIRSASRVHKDQWTESGIPFYRSSDVVSHFKGVENNKAYISNDLYKELSTKSGVPKKEDLLVTGGGSIGIPYLVPDNKPLYFKDADLLWFKKSEKLHSFFLYSFLSSDVFRKYLLSVTHIGTIAHYTIEQAKSTPITFPNFPEQQKIADFLSSVDKKIEQLTRKKELLEKYKTGMMQKLFPKAGEKHPELRFKDENGQDYPDWEIKSIGELGETYNGLNGKTKEDFGSGHPFITYKQIFDSSAIDSNRFDYVMISDGEKQNKVQNGDIFFTTSSETRLEVGFTSVLLDSIENLYLNSFCFGYRVYEKHIYLTSFFRFYFRSPSIRFKIARLGQGSTRYNLSKNELKKIIFRIPSTSEQQKIADFLSAIDDKITKVEGKLTKAQTFKKGLLQQMFV